MHMLVILYQHSLYDCFYFVVFLHLLDVLYFNILPISVIRFILSLTKLIKILCCCEIMLCLSTYKYFSLCISLYIGSLFLFFNSVTAVDLKSYEINFTIILSNRHLKQYF